MTRRSRARVGLGGLIVLTLATVSATTATATPADQGDDDPSSDADAGTTADGTFEACTENFGLGKVVEIVVEVDGSVPTPPLTYPDDVQIVTEFDFGSGPQTCLPEPVTPALWATSSFWGANFDLPPPVGNFVFLPTDDDGGDPCDATQVTQTLELVGAPPGHTVTVAQAVVPPPEDLVFCEDSFEVALDAAEPLMPASAFTALTNFVENEGNAEGCDTGDTPNADLETAWDALVAALSDPFLTLYEDAIDGETDCESVEIAFLVFALQHGYESEVGRQAVFGLATVSPEQAPEPAPIVVAPRLTG